MLFNRYKQILRTKTTISNNVQFRYFINYRFVSARCGIEEFWSSLTKHRKELYKMNSMWFILRDIRVIRVWNAWTRINVGHVVRRCRRDKSVREIINCFKQALLRPRRTLTLAATAAYYKANDEATPGKPPSWSQGISDRELEILLSDLEGVAELSKKTLFCINCCKRLIIDKKLPGIIYCTCKDGHSSESCLDGWCPYMEAEDVVIWRKEYKPGQGLYAYKVYGRYKDVRAQDFADVNLDGAYRREWDAAVAGLSVVERCANGVLDQAVLHWEVLWPRLFANRDYVYIRRHKEYLVKNLNSPEVFENKPAPAQAPVSGQSPGPPAPAMIEERPNVHSNAKRKSLEASSMQAKPGAETNKVYVIVSRSCAHAAVPETRHAIRVREYWSHMLVRTIHGADEMGMEFCLTYYDEPAVGGMPSGVATWATGRAAPQYLQRMRLAAQDYAAYKREHHQDMPDFTPFCTETKTVSLDDGEETEEITVKEEDMESSKTGPDMENGHTREQATQTDETDPPAEVKDHDEPKVTKDNAVNTALHVYAKDVGEKQAKSEGAENDEKSADEENNTASWWRYVYPSYYFM